MPGIIDKKVSSLRKIALSLSAGLALSILAGCNDSSQHSAVETTQASQNTAENAESTGTTHSFTREMLESADLMALLSAEQVAFLLKDTKLVVGDCIPSIARRLEDGRFYYGRGRGFFSVGHDEYSEVYENCKTENELRADVRASIEKGDVYRAYVLSSWLADTVAPWLDKTAGAETQGFCGLENPDSYLLSGARDQILSSRFGDDSAKDSVGYSRDFEDSKLIDSMSIFEIYANCGGVVPEDILTVIEEIYQTPRVHDQPIGLAAGSLLTRAGVTVAVDGTTLYLSGLLADNIGESRSAYPSKERVIKDIVASTEYTSVELKSQKLYRQVSRGHSRTFSFFRGFIQSFRGAGDPVAPVVVDVFKDQCDRFPSYSSTANLDVVFNCMTYVLSGDTRAIDPKVWISIVTTPEFTLDHWKLLLAIDAAGMRPDVNDLLRSF